MIFGHVFVAVQRSSSPAAGSSRVLSSIASPPHDALAAGFVDAGGAAGQRKAEVHRRLPRGDAREGAVPHHAVLLVAIEPEMDESADEIARLRVADADRVIDRAGDGIRRAGGVRLRVTEERHDVARRGEADAEHQRVSRRVDKLVEAAGAETVLQADARRVGRAGPRRRIAVGEAPVAACEGTRGVLLAGIVLTCVPRQTCVGLFETGGGIRLRRAERGETDWRRFRPVGHVVEARDDGTGDRRAVRIARDRHHDRLVGRRRDYVALPAADERHVAFRTGDRLAVAAVDDLIKEHACRLRHIYRLGQRERRDVFHLPARVSRGQIEILNDGVVRILRIDVAVHLAADEFERPGGSDGLSVVHRLARGDFESDDLRTRRRRARRDHAGEEKRSNACRSHCLAGVSLFAGTRVRDVANLLDYPFSGCLEPSAIVHHQTEWASRSCLGGGRHPAARRLEARARAPVEAVADRSHACRADSVIPRLAEPGDQRVARRVGALRGQKHGERGGAAERQSNHEPTRRTTDVHRAVSLKVRV